MNADSEHLERECHTFTRLLLGMPASPYVIIKYIDAHRVHPALGDAAGFERTLIHAASAGPFAARLADAYARRVIPRGVLRKKLVLLLAILETSRGFHREVDAGPTRSFPGAILDLAIAATAGVLAAISGLLVFGTMHLLARLTRRTS